MRLMKKEALSKVWEVKSFFDLFINSFFDLFIIIMIIIITFIIAIAIAIAIVIIINNNYYSLSLNGLRVNSL